MFSARLICAAELPQNTPADTVAFNTHLEHAVSALKDKNASEWESALQELRLIAGRPPQPGDIELLAKLLDHLASFMERADLDQQFELAPDVAQRRILESDATKEAVASWEKGKATSKVADSITVKCTRAYYLERALGIMLTVPEDRRERIKGPAIRALSNVKEADGAVHELAIETGLQYRLSAADVAPLVSRWITSKLDPVYMQKVVAAYPTFEIHDRVLDAISPWDKPALTREQQIVLSEIRPSAERAKRILDLALRDLLSDKIGATASLFFFPYAVLKNATFYGGKLTEEQQQRLVSALPGSKGAQTGLILWFVLLGPDSARNEAILREHASRLVERLAQWDYLPKPPARPNPIASASSMIDHVNDLLILAMVRDMKLDERAISALKDYSTQGRNQSDAEQWQNGSNKMQVNHYAAFSLLWRNTEPVIAVRESYAGRMARQEWYKYWGPEMPAYAYAFAADRQGKKGEPEESIIKAAINDRLKLDLTMSYPDSKYARNELPKLIGDANLKYRAVELLYYRRHMARSLADVPGLKELVISMLPTAKQDLEGYTTLQASGILATVFNDKAKAVATAEPVIREKYFPVANRPMKAWGSFLEVVLEADPDAPILEDFANRVSESKVPGKDFIAWLLKLRRGKKAGDLPIQSFQEVWRNPDCTEIMIGLSRAGENAVPYLEKLRSPYTAMNCFSAGLESGAPNPAEVAKVLAFLGALDRIEWLARGLEPQLDTVVVDDMLRRANAVMDKK